MSEVFVYVVDRDFGFAPNPFGGVCTLATCKPRVRSAASVGDWIVGMGGSRLNATGRAIFAMKVSEKLTFEDYWSDPRYKSKKPVRNGSLRTLIGDNIYSRNSQGGWQQADSHHSNADGSENIANLENDTQTNAVLISDNFFYFGNEAPEIPQSILNTLGYRNRIGHRRFGPNSGAMELISWIETHHKNDRNLVCADPFLFDQSATRYQLPPKKSRGT